MTSAVEIASTVAPAAASSFPANPFVGLRPFDTDEALLFFGRREQTIELLQQLHRTRFLAVVGSSGCGKSSLIRAGLIPQLKAGFLVEDRDDWRMAVTRPGEDPLRNLTAAVLAVGHEQATDEETNRLRDELQISGAQALLEHLKPTLTQTDTNLLLLVDQFEEVFRFTLASQDTKRRDEAADFVTIMLDLAAQRDLPVYVVMTMRSDFIGECENFYGLPEALNRSLYLVPRLTRRQRQQAIEGPIRLFGQTISARLLDRVLNDVGDQSDQLPVLQHALMRTWENGGQAGTGTIDIEHYEAAGTIRNALNKDADEALAGMSDVDLKTTKHLFQALTDTDAQSRRVRRPARLSEVAEITGAERRKILEIVERFRERGRSFLNLYGDTKDDPLIDISHESLIRQWTRLGEWIDEEAMSREIYRRIVDAARRYEKRETQLWRNPDLQLAMKWRQRVAPNAEWARRYEPGFAFKTAMAFLDRSRKRRLYRALAVGLLLGSLLGPIILAFVYLQRREVNVQLHIVGQAKEKLAVENLLEGVEEMSDGNTDQAINNFSAAVQLRPDYPDAYFYRGNAHLQKGDKRAAAADFNHYLQLPEATIEKKAKAQRFIESLQAPEARPPASNPESDERCRAAIEQMFDDDKGTRIAATSTLISAWGNYPPLIPLIVKKALRHTANKSGIINALVVLESLDDFALERHGKEIAKLLNAVEGNGPETKERVVRLRALL